LLKRSFVVLVLVGLVGCSPNGEALPQLGIDVKQTSVSGLSAGAYMAGQLQVAHSSQIIGAALVAGGPYGCAESGFESLLPAAARNTTQALEGCMSDKLRSEGIPNVTALAERAKALAKDGKIDPLEGLKSDKVYLFSGSAFNRPSSKGLLHPNWSCGRQHQIRYAQGRRPCVLDNRRWNDLRSIRYAICERLRL